MEIIFGLKIEKMKKLLPLFLILIGFTGTLPVAAQSLPYNQQTNFLNANKVWVFGDAAGLDFNSGTPSAFVSAIEANEGVASVSDPETGELLFYSNGNTNWNKVHDTMPNGHGLKGNIGLSTTDGVCIVPMIDSPGKYYLFSMTGSTGGMDPSGSLFYSVVDMNLEGGLGDIVAGQKNIILDSDTILSEAMVAIPGNNCDIWLVVHEFIEPVFKAYHITAAGINPTPVISQTGGQIHKSFVYNGHTIGSYYFGGMSVSPNRDYIAMSSYFPICFINGSPDSLVGVLVCQFDPETGEVSNAIEVGESMFSYNSAFSPDNSKLYLFSYDFFASTYELLQYDVSTFDSAAINASETVISSSLVSSEQGGYLRLYGDTIYINSYDTAGAATYLSTINQPNLSGTSCDFQFASIQLDPSTVGELGLPKEVVYPIDPITNTLAWDTLICNDWDYGISLIPTLLQAGYTYEWNDASTDSILTISTEGTYWVKYNDGCHFRTDTFKVAGEELDPVITIDVLRLSTVESYASYQWMLNGAVIPTATQNSYDVEENGDYQVIVTDGGACIDTSAIYPVNNVGIDAHPLQDQISVYPNPTEDRIYIQAPVPVNVRINDITGRTLLTWKDARSISLAGWSDGIYFLQISDQQSSIIKVEKIIKRK